MLLLFFQQEDADKEATSEREAESEEKKVDGETEQAVGEEDTSEDADKREEITQRILNIMANFLEGEVRIDLQSLKVMLPMLVGDNLVVHRYTCIQYASTLVVHKPLPLCPSLPSELPSA